MAAQWRTSMVFLLFLSLSSHASGREEQVSSDDEWADSLVSGGRCPFTPDSTFPPRVKVQMRIGSESSAQLMTDRIKGRSISPWEYSSNVDPRRFPVVINEARCLHHGCMDSEGNLDLSMNSVPIRQEIMVLRREMRGCIPIYRPEKQLVTVGCTCVRPIIHYL